MALTVVYVDSVFVLNGAMDYLLLLATGRLAGIPLRRVRYLLAALLGGSYAVAVFLPGCGFLAEPAVKAAAGLAMALVAFGGEERFFRLTLLAFLVSCGLAGCVLALGLLADSTIPVANGVFYTNVDAKVLMLSAAGAYVTLTVLFRAAARHGLRGERIPVTLEWQGRTVSFLALCDTGNSLRDPVTAQPVLVVDGSRLAGLWPRELRDQLTGPALRNPAEVLETLRAWPNAPRFRLLPYHAVGAAGLLLVFRCDRVILAGRPRNGIPVALSPTALGDGYDALWGEAEGKGVWKHVQAADGAAAAAGPVGTACAHPLHRRQRHAARTAVSGTGSGTAGPTR